MAKSSMVLVNGSVADGALADPVATATLPTTGYLAVPAGAKSVILYLGGHHDTTPVDNDYAYQVVVWRKVSDASGDASAALMYTPHLVAKGVATLGSLAMEDTSGSDYLYADTITNTLTARPDVLVFSPADNTLAWIYIELDDAVGIEMECDLSEGSGTAVTSVYALARFSEEVHPFFLNSLLSNKLGGYSGDGGAASDDSVKAELDIVYGVVGTLTTNLAAVSGYTINDGWRVLRSASILANPGVGGTNFFTVTGSVELQVFGQSVAQITGTGAETLTVQSADTTEIIAATTATDFASAGLLWVDNAGMATVPLESRMPKYLFSAKAGNTTIKMLQSGAAAWGGAGAMYLYCRWRPLSSTGAVAQS